MRFSVVRLTVGVVSPNAQRNYDRMQFGTDLCICMVGAQLGPSIPVIYNM